VAVSPAAYAQLEAIRDRWLAPLMAQITEQAERIGRLEAGRDAARSAEADARREAQLLALERDQLRAALAQDARDAARAATGGAQAADTTTGVSGAPGPLRRLWRAIRGERGGT
jgi:hypothetical protein